MSLRERTRPGLRSPRCNHLRRRSFLKALGSAPGRATQRARRLIVLTITNAHVASKRDWTFGRFLTSPIRTRLHHSPCLIISQRDHIGEFNSAIFEIIDGRELERRAWSRHKHAIREFSLIKFDQRYVRAAS